ncbi:MAG: UPF0175 family protein [Chloroflexota bacterium]
MSVIISDDILQASRMKENEFLREIAIWFYQQKRLTMGKASRLANLTRLQFQYLLASRKIPVNYDVEDFDADLATLARLGQL